MLRPIRFVFDIILKMYNHFDTLPKAVELENSRFYSVSNLAETLAWMAHLCWFFVLYYLRVFPLAYFQFFSISCYVAAIIFNRHGRHITSMSIALIEIVIHQIIAVKFVGVNAGFQYFIPVVGIFPFLMPRGNVLLKSLLLVMCTAAFLYIQLVLVNNAPLYQISKLALSVFNISNIVLSFGFIGLWALYLNVAISRAETILQTRTKELAVAEQKAEQEKIQRELEVKERDNEIYRLRNIELKNSYDEILIKNHLIEEEKNKSRNLLLNILPEETADELMNVGKASTRRYESATVIFADFVGFTQIAEHLNSEDLVNQIDFYFKAFDEIMLRHSIEKIKTIGDAYMAVGGLPVASNSHPVDVIHAAIEMVQFVRKQKPLFPFGFDIRIGIHTGPLVAGVVGTHKFQYDIWGDTVNTAARMEQHSIAGKINISGETFGIVRDKFSFISRGRIEAKNKGEIEMYFLEIPAMAN